MKCFKLIVVLTLCLVLPAAVSGQEEPWKALNQEASKLYREGKYEAATEISQQAIEVATKTFGADSLQVSTSLDNLARLYKSLGRYSEAEPVYKRSLEIAEHNLGKDHLDVAVSLDNLGELYRAQKRYTEAEPLYKRSLEIIENNLGKDDLSATILLTNLAELYRSQERYSEAEPLYKRSLEIRERKLDEDHPQIATNLTSLVMVYKAQGKYSEAESLCKRGLGIRERKLGKNHIEVGIGLYDLAGLYQAQGRYSEAEPLHKRSLEIFEQSLGKDHLAVGFGLYDLAELYRAQSRYSEAEPLYKRSLEVLEQTRGKDHPDLGSCLNGLAELYRVQERYDEAYPLYERSLEIVGQALGKNHPKTVTILNNLAMMFDKQGYYSGALPLYKKSLEVMEQTLGEDHPKVAMSLNNLATLHRAQGRYTEAEELYLRSLQIMERAFGSDNPQIASVLNNLAVLYDYQGRYSEAESLYKKSLEIMEQPLGKDHPDVATTLANLARVYQSQGKNSEALRMYETSLDILNRKGLPTKNIRNLMANLYLDQEDITKAEPIITEAGYNQTRGRLCLMKKDFKGARRYFELIRKSAQDDGDTNNLFVAYTGLGTACESLGEDTEAETYYLKAVNLTEELRSNLSRAQRETFFDVKINGFLRTAPYEGLARVRLRMGKKQEALKVSEYSKARIFAESMSKRSLDSTFDLPPEVSEQDEDLNNQLAAFKKRRQEAYEKGDKLAIEALEHQVKNLESRLQAHITMLREKCPVFAATRYPQPVDLEQTALKDTEWLLEYHVTDTGLITYVCEGRKLVKAVFKPVTREKLNQLVREFRKPLEVVMGSKKPEDHLEAKLKSFNFTVGKELLDLVLADVLDLLPKGASVIIVPDDCLGTVPFEMLTLNDSGSVKTDKGLPYISGAEFFGDRNLISYYQSATALTLVRNHSKGKSSAACLLAIADPVYREDEKRDVKEPVKEGPSGVFASLLKRFHFMGAEGGEQMGGIRFSRLEQTEKLGESLAEIEKSPADIIKGFEATKDHFLQKIKPNIKKYDKVVFATHGYFGKGLPLGINEPVLVFTLIPPGTDGFLRMTEVMGLDMNADLVTLIACQSGLGARVSGEGTMGMGRAFQYAGAKSVLMSLWSVSEVASVRLVTSFFQHLKNGKTKPEALDLARRELRTGIWNHPFFWAGFVLVGETN